jgi:dihydrofolate reductase
MLAAAARRMDALIFEADQRFYEHGLDGVDVIVHGRHSGEQQPRSSARHRLILTRNVPAIAPQRSNPNARLWNPAGATLEEALAALRMPGASLGVIGGASVFALFLGRYDVFWLTRAGGIFLPGGYPVFPSVPRRTPEDVLSGSGLFPGATRVLDAANGLSLVPWLRSAGHTRNLARGGSSPYALK